MPVRGNSAAHLGETIRRIRTRMQKSQAEFADILASQPGSISRYEKGLVEPGLPLLWKLFALAEPDEKAQLRDEISAKLGRDLGLGPDSLDAGMLRYFAGFEAELDGVYKLNRRGRTDFKKFSAVVLDLFMTSPAIDDALIEMLQLWKEHGHRSDAAAHFNQAVTYLRIALAKKKSVA